MSKARCHENAFCEVCRFGDFSGKCFAVESQREIVAHYGGYEQFELMSFCLDKDQRISELEEQLKNAIVPKFKIGDKCWAIKNATNIYNEPKQVLIKEIKITKNCIKYYSKNGCCTSHTNKTTMHLQSQLFATKEEAQAKLEELGERG